MMIDTGCSKSLVKSEVVCALTVDNYCRLVLEVMNCNVVYTEGKINLDTVKMEPRNRIIDHWRLMYSRSCPLIWKSLLDWM